MTTKIPSALKWLATKRARLAGELKKAELALWRVEITQQEIDMLKADLKSIDQTIRLHEIAINPENISSIGTQTATRKFKHGAITKAIYAALSRAGNEALTTTQITAAVAKKGANLDQIELMNLRFAVRKLLRAKYAEGKVERLHTAKTSLEGRWRLKNWNAIENIGRPKRKT
ncbi:hypothetical protein [Herminiimonas fonticola]|uniref:Uncharacterized protein n=1 Tax=Herminiimonas fonticola TaxID=303380 RepID=A0A4R6GI30_9BURK|nr:hypothetical protein [Herminiimonas fonticola]RBA25493.1 hypothetical protein Hfont_1126 [Herminiimonas fonticola]TDN94606.1 hypothetical protein EV677_1157 [Herminiimonas fonticola]